MYLAIECLHTRADAVSYLTQKLQAVTQASALLAQTMAFDWLGDLQDDRVRIPLATPDETPRYSPLHLRYALGLVDDCSPLVEGEVRDDSTAIMSYLTEDFAAHPAGTVALRVTTSHATLVYLFLGSYYSDGTIYRYRHSPDRLASEDVPTEPSPYQPPAPPEFSWDATLNSAWGAVGSELAKGLAGGIGSMVGTAIFEAVFGQIGGVPTWYGDVYQQFTHIVRQAFDDQWMRELEADMDAVSSMIRQYNAAGERFMLEAAWKDVTTLTNRLKKFGKTAVANFTVGGGLHLLVLQQLALTSEDRNGYLNLIKAQAAEYGAWALAQRQTLYSDRMAMITGVMERWEPASKQMLYTWCDYGAIGQQCHSGQNSCGHKAKEVLQQQRDAHYAAVDAATQALLSPVVTVTSEWKKLEQQPLPPS